MRNGFRSWAATETSHREASVSWVTDHLGWVRATGQHQRNPQRPYCWGRAGQLSWEHWSTVAKAAESATILSESSQYGEAGARAFGDYCDEALLVLTRIAAAT